MAGSADAAKNALESIFHKTKETLQTAAETTKGYANQAIGKITGGHDAGASNAQGAAPTDAANNTGHVDSAGSM